MFGTGDGILVFQFVLGILETFKAKMLIWEVNVR